MSSFRIAEMSLDKVSDMYRSLLATFRHERQSPIDIIPSEATIDSELCKESDFRITYNEGDAQDLEVSPGICRVNIKETSSSCVTASHLPATFKLAQFHFHWGEDSSLGSEHRINGHTFSGETHFVFWNIKYDNIDEAMHHPDGLAVVAVILKEGEYNDAYNHVTSRIRKALENKGRTTVDNYLDINLMLPHDKAYYTYEGSLTTPPHSENVIWTVMMNPVQVSPKQLTAFRLICSSNHRQCQMMAGRKLYCSRKDKNKW